MTTDPGAAAGHLFERNETMQGIGAYFNPDPIRPVAPPQAAAPAASGLGSYFNPVPLRPVRPPEATVPQPTHGLGEMSESQKAAMGILALIVVGIFLLRKK